MFPFDLLAEDAEPLFGEPLSARFVREDMEQELEDVVSGNRTARVG